MIRSTQDQLRDIREESATEFSVTHIDTCLPDYLQDHHNRDGELLLGVPVNADSTVGEVMDGLLDEFRAVAWDLGEYRKGYSHDKAKAAVKGLIVDNDERRDRIFDSSLERVPEGEEDYYESPQAWFLIHWDVPDEDEEGGDAASPD